MTETRSARSDIELLTALGFGPETLLSSEPKLFLNGRFLSALIVELEEQLGIQGGRRALFQIGLLHGFRDAYRIANEVSAFPGAHEAATTAESPLVAISLAQAIAAEGADLLELPGSWPECYEAEARLAKQGPSPRPACALSAGYTSGWLSGSFDADVLVIEEECSACGAAQCRFVAREVVDWQADVEVPSRALIDATSFDTYRDISRGFALQQEEASLPSPDLRFDSTAVHVWGPVMVLPFEEIDDALQTVEMLGRDPETSHVRAVVVDLRGRELDEGFAAAALEQILESIEAWGAEAILTNVSTLSEPIVAELEVRHLLLRKDLSEAIAAAFQIAEAQRHLL